MVSRYLVSTSFNWSITWMMYAPNQGCKSWLTYYWGMATMLHIIVIVFVVGHLCPWSMPLAMLNMKKELHGFLFICIHVVLFLLLWCCAKILRQVGSIESCDAARLCLPARYTWVLACQQGVLGAAAPVAKQQKMRCRVKIASKRLPCSCLSAYDCLTEDFKGSTYYY